MERGPVVTWQPPYRYWWRDALGILSVFAVAGRLPSQYASLLMVAVMLYGPLALRAQWWLPVRADRVRAWAAISVVVLLGYGSIMAMYSHWRGQTWLWPHPALPWSDIGRYALMTTVSAAIPEEFFFRGFLLQRWQTETERSAPRPWWRPSSANVKIALVFALVHVVADFNIRRLEVFFPALWYGAIAERGGSLPLAVVAHAMSNLAMYVALHAFGYL